jgi:hypothetical protein
MTYVNLPTIELMFEFYKNPVRFKTGQDFYT